MSPYIVKVGEVRSIGQTWSTGDELPDGIGDEAMVAVGAIEWVGDDPPSVPETAAEPAADQFATMKAGELRDAAKALDPPLAFPFGTKKDEMVAALRARAALPGGE